MGRIVGFRYTAGIGILQGEGEKMGCRCGEGLSQVGSGGLYNGGTRSRVGRVGNDGMRGQQHTMTPPAAAMAAWLTAFSIARCPKAWQA